MSGSKQPDPIDVEARVREYYTYLDRLAARMPDEWVEESRERLVNALLADLAREPWPERARRWIVELFTERPLALTGLVTATLAVIVCAVLLHDPASPRPEAPDAVAQADAVLPTPAPTVATPSAPTPTPATAKDAPAVAATPSPIAPAAPAPAIAEHPTTEQKPAPDTLATLRAEFERLKASDAGVDRAYLVRLVDYIVAQEDRETAEFGALCLLLVETYEQMGERDRALAAYGRYLDIVEAREGPEQAALLAWRRADEIFRVRQEHLEGLGYADIILTRWPESPQAREARLMPGRYYALSRMWSEAARAYAWAAEQEGSAATRGPAQWQQAVMLANGRRLDEAVAVLQSAAAAATDEALESESRYLLGVLLTHHGGVSRYPAALRELRRVVELQSAKQSSAEAMIARIHNSTLQDIGAILN